MFNIKRNFRGTLFKHIYVCFSYGNRYVAYAFVIILMLYVFLTLYDVKPGIYIDCRCSSETKSEERVAKYLSTLLKEKNSLTNRFVGDEAEEEHPSLPVKFLSSLEADGKRCNLLPGFFDIKHRNILWQEAQIGTSTFLLFSAFYDDRDEKEGPLIRILAMADRGWPTMPTCHLYFTNNSSEPPVATKAIRADFIHWQSPKAGQWHPFLVTCRAGNREGRVAKVVSLVTYPCSKPSNALKVNSYEIPEEEEEEEEEGEGGVKKKKKKKKKLALCHKFLYNSAQDYSHRIIEWLEISKVFGIDKVTMYLSSAHQNVKKVLNYYKDTGFLNVIPWTNPGSQTNVPSLLRSFYDTQRYSMFTDENIPYTDCLLRHIYSHEYVGVWDMDEIMIPLHERTIPQMIDNALSNWQRVFEGESTNAPTSYLARTSYFLDDNIDYKNIEKKFSRILNSNSFAEFNNTITAVKLINYFHILSHTILTARFSPTRIFTKSVHDTSRALALHAHFALYNLEGRVNKETDLYELNPHKEGFLGHFRNKCQGENQTNCEQNFRPYLKVDETVWQYSHDIIYNTLHTIKELQLF